MIKTTKHKFYRINSPDKAASFIAKRLASHLQKGPVLLLLSGGSAIEVATGLSSTLKSNLGNLYITLIDERYGEVGHKDSNWAALDEAGFSVPGSHLVPVLDGEDIEQTAADFSSTLNQLLNKVSYSLGVFGIGPDGHTAGILPGSAAVDSNDYAVYYQGPDYQRITTTPRFIEQLDEAVVYAVGEAKWGQLDKLEKDIPVAEQPAQVLKKIAKLTIFNDYKGEEV